jgi:hypothetical protein
VTVPTNHYCKRLDLPVPRLEEYVGKRDIKLFDLMVVALLQHGAPLSSELLATRLTAAGVESATGDMAYSLQKAWHGMEPVYRDAEGRWGLNLSSSELKYRLFRMEQRGARTTPVAAEPDPVPEPIPDDVPLTEAKLRWAFADRSLYNISPRRQPTNASTPQTMGPKEVDDGIAGVTGRDTHEPQSYPPQRQPPCARVPRLLPVAAQAKPCVSSFRLRDAVSSLRCGNRFRGVSQLDQACQTPARKGPRGNRLGVLHL